MALRIGARIGAYELRPLEGRGATANVFRAVDTKLRREVALKVIEVPPDASGSPCASLLRLEREAQILASLEHPNIARVHGVEHADGVHAIVMELVEGPTLADRLAAGPLPVREALDIAVQVAFALEAVHDRRVVHRDLKPSNIKTARDGTVKVLDFGLARVLRPLVSCEDRLPSTITPDAVAVGTAAYMSPEQARGHEVDHRTDIWAFACVVYEMLTGMRAFPGNDTASTFAAVLTSEPDWTRVPVEVPATALAFIKRCLKKEVADRPRHIGDVRLALEGVFETEKPRVASAGGRTLAAAALAVVAAFAVPLSWGHSADREAKSYVIHSPEGTQFNHVTMEPYPSLSPDGHYVAYRTATDSPGTWVQQLGHLTSRRLHTGLLGRPFWSPDGRFIGLAGSDGIQVFAVQGESAPQTICACLAIDGATWGHGETILFSDRRGLSRLPAGGGTITPVTSLAEERGEFAHQHPIFLPDGRRFLYLVRSTQPDHGGIFIASLDNPMQARRLLPDDSNVSYGIGPDGRTYLLFVRDVTLVAQPFAVQAGTLSGSPVVIAPRVVPGEGGRLAPFSAAGRSIVFRQTTPPRSRLRWFDRRGVSQPGAFERVGAFRYVALSRDGRALAVSEAHSETTKLDVWVHDLERNVSERMTTDPIGAFFPVWTPGGDRVIYASAREGPWHIFWRSRDKPDAGRLLAGRSPFTKYPSAVTTDGRYVVFHGDGTVWALDLSAGSEPIRLVDGSHGRVSPDGRWLAYSSSENGRREVYVTSFPNAGVRRRISRNGGEDPQWRADGQELFFVDADRLLIAASLSLTPTFETKEYVHLFRAAIDERVLQAGASYAPAPDGQRFLIIERVDHQEVVLTAMENWQSARSR
jgi:Tol biopolymer transport system component